MSEIEIRNVKKRYGTVTALDGVSLSVNRGDTFGLIGRNGAGKTTLFKLLVGHDTPDSGSVSVAGLAPSDGTELRRRVGYLPERAGFPSSFTGREELTFHARVRGVPGPTRDRRVERVLHTVGLADAADRTVDGYSNGMHRRLGLATALVGMPDVLLLDEPTAGLDPTGVSDFHEIVEGLSRETDITLIITSHVLAEVERLCNRVAILNDGGIDMEGDVAELRRTTGETVSVAATIEGDPGDVAGEVGELDGVVTATADSERVRIECNRASVFDVLDALREIADFVAVEVTEPGLDAVFREAVSTSDGDTGPPLEVEHNE